MVELGVLAAAAYEAVRVEHAALIELKSERRVQRDRKRPCRSHFFGDRGFIRRDVSPRLDLCDCARRVCAAKPAVALPERRADVAVQVRVITAEAGEGVCAGGRRQCVRGCAGG